jgi:hypothetical protein
MNSDVEMRASTIGSVQPIDVAFTQAFRAQSHDIVWEQFLRGHISNHWGHAYQISQTNPRLDPITWALYLIKHIFN